MRNVFAALADENRLRILDRLRVGAITVGDLATALELRQPQVSKHLASLKEAGLVDVERRAQHRIYALRLDGLKRLDSWLEDYRTLWAARMEQLDHVLVDLLEKEPGSNDHQ